MLSMLLRDEDALLLLWENCGPSAPGGVGSMQACLAGAVRMSRPHVVNVLLAKGANPNFQFQDLPPAVLGGLVSVGASLYGCEHLCPLSLAVQQHSTAIVGALLQHGAVVREAPCGRPLLMRYLEAAELRTAVSTLLDYSSGSPSAASSSSSSSGATASSPGVPVLKDSMRLLAYLLQHGADPFLQDATVRHRTATFLSECRHPVLLRLAVTLLQRQLESGQRQALNPAETQQVLDAAVRLIMRGRV